MIIWLFINKMHRYSVNIEQVEQDDMMHALLSRDTPRIWSLIRIIAHHRGLASFMSPAHFRRLRPFLTIPTKLYRKNDTSENFQSHRDAKSSRNITIKSASFFTLSEQTYIRERRRDGLPRVRYPKNPVTETLIVLQPT